jgi:hypothetical protein
VEGTNCGEEDEEAHAAGYWEDGRRGTARSWLAAGTADEEALGSEWRGRTAPEEGGGTDVGWRRDLGRVMGGDGEDRLVKKID